MLKRRTIRMVDVVQSRYGWTDDYVFDTMPAERVRQIFEIVISQKSEERLTDMRLHAYSVWLDTSLTHGSVGSFEEFLTKVGLSYVDPDEIEAAKEVDGNEVARNILSRFRPNEEVKN